MTHQAQVKCIWPAQARLGEGVVWIEQEQALYWVDILKETLHRFHPSSGEQKTWPQKPMISAILPTQIASEESTFIATYADSIKLLHKNQTTSLLTPQLTPATNRLNDAWVAPNGDLWFGTMDNNVTQTCGQFYRLTPDLQLTQLPEQYLVTNGPTFCAVQNVAYFVDTIKHTILRANINQDGSVSALTPHIQTDPAQGVPDGITIDAQQHLWVAHFNGAKISRYTPAGELERQIDIPALNVTKCAFGGENLSTLYVVTAREGMSEEQLKTYPLSGGVFAIELSDVQGISTPKFTMKAWPAQLK